MEEIKAELELILKSIKINSEISSCLGLGLAHKSSNLSILESIKIFDNCINQLAITTKLINSRLVEIAKNLGIR